MGYIHNHMIYRGQNSVHAYYKVVALLISFMYSNVRYEDPKTLVLRILVFWDIALCSGVNSS